MKGIKLILLGLLTASLANAQSPAQIFNLDVLSDGKLIIKSAQLFSEGYDSKIEDASNAFEFTSPVDLYGLYTLTVSYVNAVSKKTGMLTVQLFLIPGDTKLTFQGTAGKYKVTGAAAVAQKNFEALVSKDQARLKRVQMFEGRLHQYQKSANRRAAAQVKDSIARAERERRNVHESYIEQHPADVLSLYAMSMYSMINYENPLEIKSLLTKLDADFQNTEAMVQIKREAEENEKFMKGKPAPQFTQKDTSGVDLALTSLQGQYVLIDFWASWCKPCRAQNPSLVRAYQKYKSRGFTILGVSLDSKKEAWLKAIYDDKLEWQHVSDLKFWNNDVAKQYKIAHVPQNYLLNPHGVIIGKNISEEDLDQVLEAELSKSK